MRKSKIFIGLIILSMIIFAAACGGGAATGGSMKTIMEKKVNEKLTVTLASADGKLKTGKQDLMIAFTDGAGKPLEIEAAALSFNMPAMGTMAEMNNSATLRTTSTPGQFSGSVHIEVTGDWTARISYEGTETGKTTMKVTAH